MKKPVILSVASISRMWLNNFAKIELVNHSSFTDAVMGRSSRVPLLTVSNHISTIDDPVMWGGLLTNKMISELIDRGRMRYIPAAKEIVFTNPFYHWFFSTGQAIPIERGRGVYQPGMDLSIRIINSGGWLHFFPEGRVIQNFEMKALERLKWGIGRLIMEAETPPIVLPIILKGFDRMKPLDKLPKPFQQAEIVIGEAESSELYLKSTSHIADLESGQRDETIYLKLDQDEMIASKRRGKGRKYLTLLLLLTGMLSFIAFVGTYIAFSAITKTVIKFRNQKKVSSGNPISSSPVLLISIDGFRYDFLHRGLTPNIAYLARRGIHGPLRPQFPSYTFPNHFTLVTGLYPETHGIVANAFYDPALNEYFSYTDQQNLRESKWWGAEPIWNTVQSFGLKSATMFWPGSECAIGGKRPNYYHKYNGQVSHLKRITQVLNWLSLPANERPKFLSLYLSAVDEAGHNFGPDSIQLNTALKEVDDAVGLLISGLKNREKFNKINIILVSDHGMIEVKRHIYLDDLIESLSERVEWVDYGPVASIKPVPGEEDSIYSTLKAYQLRGMKYTVYFREDIPSQFHYQNNDRIAPIIMIAESGWIIDFRGGDWVPKGAHGYDPRLEEMQALFIGSGPDFPAGKEPVSDVSNLDVYPLMMHLLNIPANPNNGTMKLVELTA